MPQSDVILVPTSGIALKSGDRSIGAILIDAGRLKAEDAERILRVQREQSLRFGDAAIQLGLITQADIDLALSRQFDYQYLLRGQSEVSEEVVTAYAPFTPQVETLRALRTQLMLRWFDTDVAHKALAIVSTERKEGRSFIAANLAVVFSQLGEHTLLIDADMRNPCQHRLFGLDNRAGLSAVLSGRGGPDAVQRIPSLRDLSVLPAGAQPPNPSELLGRPLFSQLLHECATEFDVILLDTPAAAETTDAQTVTMRAGCALIVVRKNASRAWRVRGIADHAVQTNTTIVGTVLNDF
jgi:chain length determinant protein tyrosine kinase EpsG